MNVALKSGAQKETSTTCVEPMAMRGLLHPVSAERHAAPPSPMSSRVVAEQQRAAVALTGFHVGEILSAHELRKRLRDRQQQRLG